EGVRTAADLAALPTDHVRAHYGVVLARTQMELRGIPCSDLELEEPERQQLFLAKSFETAPTPDTPDTVLFHRGFLCSPGLFLPLCNPGPRTAFPGFLRTGSH
ncbi:TPA: hypothetical protein ACOEOK_004719, partial [Stenotrophomonas maltophilia]